MLLGDDRSVCGIGTENAPVDPVRVLGREEHGLIGSRYWLAHPTVPIERVKLAITIDMVGRLRDEQLYVLGTRSGYGLRRLFCRSDR